MGNTFDDILSEVGYFSGSSKKSKKKPYITKRERRLAREYIRTGEKGEKKAVKAIKKYGVPLAKKAGKTAFNIGKRAAGKAKSVAVKQSFRARRMLPLSTRRSLTVSNTGLSSIAKQVRTEKSGISRVFGRKNVPQPRKSDVIVKTRKSIYGNEIRTGAILRESKSGKLIDVR